MKHKNAQIVCFLTRSKVTPTMKNQLCAEFNVYMPEILMANILAVCGWDGGVKVTVTPRILSCCAPPGSASVPLYFALPPQFSVPLCSVLCAPMSCPVFLEAKSPGLLAFCSSFDGLSLLLQQACAYPTKPQWNPGRFCP